MGSRSSPSLFLRSFLSTASIPFLASEKCEHNTLGNERRNKAGERRSYKLFSFSTPSFSPLSIRFFRNGRELDAKPKYTSFHPTLPFPLFPKEGDLWLIPPAPLYPPSDFAKRNLALCSHPFPFQIKRHSGLACKLPPSHETHPLLTSSHFPLPFLPLLLLRKPLGNLLKPGEKKAEEATHERGERMGDARLFTSKRCSQKQKGRPATLETAPAREEGMDCSPQ